MNYLTLSSYIALLKEKKTFPFSNNTMNTIYHIITSILDAEKGNSQIDPETEEGKEILEFNDFIGTRARHFYNNICSKIPNVKYLELGTSCGVSSFSATYKNKIEALFIDDWSGENKDLDKFIDNISKFGSDSSCYLLDNSCSKTDLSSIDTRFNICTYDGNHTEIDDFKVLRYYLPILENEFIYIVDDWNWPDVRDSFSTELLELNLEIKFRHEFFISSDDLKKMPNHKGKDTWWNGVGIFLLSKT